VNAEAHWHELEELDALIAESSTPETSGYFGAHLTLDSLVRRRADLLGLMLAQGLDATERLDLVLQASASSAAGADVGFVARLLSELQESISAIAQALTRGATRRGVVPIEIQELVRLRLATALPGSLALRMVPSIPSSAARQLELTGEGGEAPSLLELATTRLIETVSSASDANHELLGLVAELGPRASLHLRELARIIATGATDVSFGWASELGTAHAALTRDTAIRLHTFLEGVEESITEVTVAGRLVGGSLVRRRFEIELPDETILSGSAGDEALAAVERYFGQACVATLQVRHTDVRGGETREAYTLLHLSQ
jgi:hypothetical protein